MNARKYNTRNGSKMAVDLSHYFSSSDESLDDDLLQILQAAPVSTHKPIFQVPKQTKKIRQSLVNQNKFASSTPMHGPQKAFHRSIPLSPVVTHKYNTSRPNGSKMAVDLSHYFSSSDESLDDDLLQTLQAAPVSTHKPIFQVPKQTKKIRQSLVNQNKFASSTPMHGPQKASHRSIPLSPVVTHKYNTSRPNGSKLAVDMSHYFSSSDEGLDDDLLQNVQAGPVSTHKRIFEIPEQTKKIRQSLVNRNKFASSTPMHESQKASHRSIPLSPVENEGSEGTLVKSRRSSSITSKQSEPPDTVWLDQLLSCHLNDDLSEIPSPHNTMIAEDQPLMAKELYVRLEKLNSPELPEEEVVQRIHDISSRTKSKVAIRIEENDINTDRESCAAHTKPNINIIENIIINEIPTSTNGANKENFKPSRGRNEQKRNKKFIPEIITDTGDESQDPELRRSKRKRKQRVFIYNPQILVINNKESREYALANKGPQSWYKQDSALQEINYEDRASTQKSRKSSKIKKNTSAPNRKLKKVNGTRNSKTVNKSIVDVTGEQSEIEPVNPTVYNSIKSIELTEIDNNSPTGILKNTEINRMDLNDNVEGRYFNNSVGQTDPQIYPDSKQRNYFYFPMNNKVCKINYCFPDFSLNTTGENESLRIAPRCKSSYAGFESGVLEIQPGQAKMRKVAVKFSKVFIVLQGKGLFCVHDSYCIVEYGGEVYVPLGTSYCIGNQSQTDKLLLHYIKMEPKRF